MQNISQKTTGIYAEALGHNLENRSSYRSQAVAVAEELTFPAIFGRSITDPGIPFGKIEAENGNTVKLNLIPDYVRDASGEPLQLNCRKAIDCAAALSKGVRNGLESEIAQSVLEGEFKSGSYILARNADLERIMATRKTNPLLDRFNKTIGTGSFNNSWCVSSTEAVPGSCDVRHVRLRDGNYGWYGKDEDRSRVVLLRGRVYNSYNL